MPQLKSAKDLEYGDVSLDFGALSASTAITVTFSLPEAKPADYISVAPQEGVMGGTVRSGTMKIATY
jgi:hypothetical protein